MFNRGSSYFHVALTTVRHLLNVGRSHSSEYSAHAAQQHWLSSRHGCRTLSDFMSYQENLRVSLNGTLGLQTYSVPRNLYEWPQTTELLGSLLFYAFPLPVQSYYTK